MQYLAKMVNFLFCFIVDIEVCLREQYRWSERVLQAKNIKNKPIVNRDPQSIRFEEMQCEINVSKRHLKFV